MNKKSAFELIYIISSAFHSRHIALEYKVQMADNTTKSTDPIFPEVKMNLVTPKSPVVGTVVKSEVCLKGGRKSASFVRHVEIDISGTPLEGNCRAGQSFGVIAPGEDANGKPHKVRLYSLASPTCGEDGEGKIIATTPKRVIDEYTPQKDGDDEARHDLFLGVCSNYTCSLKVGDKVQVTGPSGKRFLLPVDHNKHDYIFMATGTGIAPFRSMCKDLFENPDGPTTSQVHVVMGTPYTTDLLYDDFFVELSENHDNFHYHAAVSREKQPDGSRGLYVGQLIDKKYDDVFGNILTSDRGLMYMCGLIGMQFGIYQIFAERGITDAYMTIKDELKDIPCSEWNREQMRRYIKPTHRMMVEVY
jgi:ferredoxin--NADP+ reductase